MATNADFDALIVRITDATNTLEADVATIGTGAGDITAAVIAAQLAETNAEAAAITAVTESAAAAALVSQLEAAVIIEEAPIDGQTYGRKDAAWVVNEAGGGAVDSVNGQIGVVVLAAADVDALPDTYVPDWLDVTGKPTTFTPSAHVHAASDVTSGIFDVARIPDLAASKVTSGTFDAARIPNLDAAKITTGVVAPARLGTGTPTASTVLLGDGTWGSAPAASGGHPTITFKYKGTNVSNWPLANPNEAIWIGDCANTAGTVSGEALFSSGGNLANLPAGRYCFRSTDFASGGLSGKIGFIQVDRGEVAAANFQNRAFAYVQGTGTVGESYTLKTSDGTWLLT